MQQADDDGDGGVDLDGHDDELDDDDEISLSSEDTLTSYSAVNDTLENSRGNV